MIEKTRQFWTVTNTFSERCNLLDVIAVKIFPKSFTVSSQRAKTWRQGWKNDRFFYVFWPLLPGFWTFLKSPSSVLIACKKTCLCQIWCKSVERRLRKVVQKKKNWQHNIMLCLVADNYLILLLNCLGYYSCHYCITYLLKVLYNITVLELAIERQTSRFVLNEIL